MKTADRKRPEGLHDELLVNGLSVVFHDIAELDRELDNAEVEQLGRRTYPFSVVSSQHGYLERIFALTERSRLDHLVVEHKPPIKLPPLKLENGEVVQFNAAVFCTVFLRRYILVQSIIVVDRNGISGRPEAIAPENPVTTSDILTVIHAAHSSPTDFARRLRETVRDVLSAFLLGLEVAVQEGGISSKRNQSLAVQIWDIANIEIGDDGEVDGTALAERFAWELAAILSCHNEHFTRDGLWKKQSPNHVLRSVKSTTDVLRDHQVLLSERVCVEVSQIDFPRIREISASRLFTYGYDSTSTFLWGYLILIDAAIEVSFHRTERLLGRIEEELSAWAMEVSPDANLARGRSDLNSHQAQLGSLVRERLAIARDVARYRLLWKDCVEERHRFFLQNGASIRGITEVAAEIEDLFRKIKELAFDYSQVLLTAQTNSFGEETNTLLQEVKGLNESAMKSGGRISMLQYLVGVLAVIPIADYVVDVAPSLNTVLFRTAFPAGLLVFLLILLGIVNIRDSRDH